MNYGDKSKLTADDIKDLKALYELAWSGKLTTINGTEIRQFKSCQITAAIDYVNLRSNQLIQSFPLTSEFTFENVYSNYKGDRRAADDNYIYFDKKVVPFPSGDQIIYDTGENLKAKIKELIRKNQVRN